MMKSHENLKVEGIDITIGINNVMIFHYENADIELWKDKDESYHVGLAYFKNNGEELRYSHKLLGEEPKKWNDKVNKAKNIYDDLAPKIVFTNYMK